MAHYDREATDSEDQNSASRPSHPPLGEQESEERQLPRPPVALVIGTCPYC